MNNDHCEDGHIVRPVPQFYSAMSFTHAYVYTLAIEIAYRLLMGMGVNGRVRG